MAKVKLLKFELVASIADSKRLVDFLQRFGCTHIDNADNSSLTKYDNTQLILEFQRRKSTAGRALDIIERACEVKKSLLSSLSDFSEIDYDEYRQFLQSVDETYDSCVLMCKLEDEINELKLENIRLSQKVAYYTPWAELDIPMSSTRTLKSRIFIGYLKNEMTAFGLKERLAELIPDVDGIEIQSISSTEEQSCFVVICHESVADEVEKALSSAGFMLPDDPAKSVPAAAIRALDEKIRNNEESINKLKAEFEQYSDWIDRFKYLIDYYDIQITKYKALELAGSTERIIYFNGYVPEGKSEELKFEIESRFIASVELIQPDFENEDVPVLIKSTSFASGVESVTNMYSVPSNDDVDPNPVMGFFYYSLFGLMLSDAGYGILMVIFGLLMKYKFKVTGAKRKTANFAFYCGLSTMIWGALFGSWFGDLIPTICTTFLHMENPPNLVIWFDPKEDSMKLLLYSFLFGIIHLFVGLAIRFYNLCRHRDFVSAFCDTIPVYVFISGFAIVAKDFIEPVSEAAKSVGTKLLIVGAVLIVLTAGHSAKNIVGKLGGGLYGLYNTTTGYMSDILSYSRLLALNLVTGVIAMVVNLLAAMPGNILIFIVIFIIGHGVNLAINLIGTYVHTNRLQYVEFFSKFYEGGGRSFTPFKLDTNYLRFKEDNINE